eukprot:XP_025000219.1 wiskott-Aldrich syndrome protein homolog [Gallus gallus]
MISRKPLGAPRGPGGGFGAGPGRGGSRRGGQGRSPPPSAGTRTNPGGPRSALTCTGSFSCAAARPPPPQRGALPPGRRRRPPPPCWESEPPPPRAPRQRVRSVCVSAHGATARPGPERNLRGRRRRRRPHRALLPALRAAPAGAAPPAAVSPERAEGGMGLPGMYMYLSQVNDLHLLVTKGKAESTGMKHNPLAFRSWFLYIPP